MTEIWAIVFGFVLTTLAGGYIAQAWQRRNWHLQQRFLGHEKEYNNLKELVDELVSMLGARIYHMQRIVLSIGMDDPEFAARLSDYDDVTKKWNERLASFYSRLAILATYDDALRLERIQTALVTATGLIDYIVKDRKKNQTIDKGKTIDRGKTKAALQSLNTLQGRHQSLSKSLLNAVDTRRFEVYYGRYIPYGVYNLQYFSTWQLIKALFVREIDSYRILCSTVDIRFPSERGGQRAGIDEH